MNSNKRKSPQLWINKTGCQPPGSAKTVENRMFNKNINRKWHGFPQVIHFLLITETAEKPRRMAFFGQFYGKLSLTRVLFFCIIGMMFSHRKSTAMDRQGV
jgi:hypothetical protein